MRLLLAIVLVLFLFACQKEPDFTLIDPSSPTQSTNKCKLLKSYEYNLSGAPIDSALYTYLGDKVIKISGHSIGDSITFNYNGTTISKRNYYNGGALVGYDNLYYYTDGSIKKIESYYDMSFFGGGWDITDSITFIHSNGKLSQRSKYSINVFSPGLMLEEENFFTFTNNNLTKEIRRKYGSGGGASSADTSIMVYDTEPNLLKKQNFPHLLANPVFMQSYAHYYSLFLSDNNLTKGYDSQFPTDTENFTYIKDALGNVVEIIANGDKFLSFKLDCK
jgi:hypothetical protein